MIEDYKLNQRYYVWGINRVVVLKSICKNNIATYTLDNSERRTHFRNLKKI